MLILEENLSGNLFYDYLNEYDIFYVFNDFINSSSDRQQWKLIPFTQYKQALTEYTKYGKFMRFPTNKIYQWLKIIMMNVAIIEANNELDGRHSGWDSERMWDLLNSYTHLLNDDKTYVKNQNNQISNSARQLDLFRDNLDVEYNEREELDFEQTSTILDKMGFYDWRIFPDGSDAVSDFGIEPIEKLIATYNNDSSPEETIVIINKILDIMHQRGDLASAFIEGGRKSLTNITFNESKKSKSIIISEAQISIIKEKLMNL